MKDTIAELLLTLSAFAAIVVMLLIIVKERRKQKTSDKKKAKNHVKRNSHTETGRLYLD